MKVKKLAISIAVLLCAVPALVISAPPTIMKGGKVTVTQVSVTVSPEAYTGSCPKKFTYTARITANGSGEVRYRWVTSDTSISRILTMNFIRSSSKTISITKEYRTNGTYWASLEILSPSRITSNRATCRLVCVPVAIRPSFRISGNVNGGPEGNLLNGRKVKITLKRSGRTLMSRTLTLNSTGRCDYQFAGPYLGAGNYTLSVEKVASDPSTATGANVCFRGTNPPSRSVTLANSSPTATNQDFVINFVIAWDSPLCW